ncbi:MAG: DUF5680 domain-containing protein [bacterium]|nr:DUF5680 domain-containing protein [bacterium]
MDIKDVEAFFFEASLNTYLGEPGTRKGETISISHLPQAKCWEYSNGLFLYRDIYYVSSWGKGEKTGGQTVIWFANVPVWIMQYRGQYPDRAISLLRWALLINMKSKTFKGGRGPDECTVSGSGLIYRNATTRNEFTDFEGREEIVEGELVIGEHSYAGLSLL